MHSNTLTIGLENPPQITQDHVVWHMPSKAIAIAFLRSNFSDLSKMVLTWGRTVQIFYIGGDRPYEIEPETAELSQTESMGGDRRMGVALTEMVIHPGLMDVFKLFADNPGEKLVLIRTADERQVWVSEAVQAHIQSATPLEATKRKRSDFWVPEDLAQFNQNWEQGVRVDDDRPLDSWDDYLPYKWRCFDPVTRSNFRKFHSQLRFFKAGGVGYHICRTVEVKAIAPVAI